MVLMIVLVDEDDDNVTDNLMVMSLVLFVCLWLCFFYVHFFVDIYNFDVDDDDNSNVYDNNML